jgi:hypothetical protein
LISHLVKQLLQSVSFSLPCNAAWALELARGDLIGLDGALSQRPVLA